MPPPTCELAGHGFPVTAAPKNPLRARVRTHCSTPWKPVARDEREGRMELLCAMVEEVRQSSAWEPVNLD